MNKKVKVLYVITKSNFGGAQRYVFDLATHLPKNTFSAVVACGGTGERGAPHGELVQRLEREGVRTVKLAHFMRNMSLTEDMRAFFEVLRLIRKESPDVLHLSSSKAGGIGALVGRITRVPVIVFTSHGLTFEESWRPKWQRALIWLMTWCTILLSTHTILISKDNERTVRAMPLVKKKARYIPNGIVPPTLLAKERARHALVETLPPYAPALCSIAEYHENKNLSLLVRAMSMLESAPGKKAHAVLIGEGEQRKVLEDTARRLGVSSRVHLTGFMTHAATYLSACDVFVLPSKKEGLPYVILEAGCAGIPVIASDIPAHRAIITHKKDGLLVPHTVEALGATIDYALTHPQISNRYGAALQQKVCEEFSIKRMVERTVSLYTSTNPSIS